jgi:hypothetical protein
MRQSDDDSGTVLDTAHCTIQYCVLTHAPRYLQQIEEQDTVLIRLLEYLQKRQILNTMWQHVCQNTSKHLPYSTYHDAPCVMRCPRDDIINTTFTSLRTPHKILRAGPEIHPVNTMLNQSTSDVRVDPVARIHQQGCGEDTLTEEPSYLLLS